MTHRDFHDWLLQRWYGSRPIWFFIPLAGVFAALTALRRWAYKRGILETARLRAPVIVVGNITVGGTGKTPFVIWLAQALTVQGYQPGIITRGYGGKSERWPLLVTPATDPVLAGDEAVLLARHTHLPVMAGPDRVKAAQRLQTETNVDVIISDDGLQHYHLPRAVDIIMLDGRRGFGNFWLLPAGPLRESTVRVNEVDFVICKTDSPATASMPPGTLVMRMVLKSVVRLADGSSMPLTKFSSQRVHAVAGIGHPQQFFAALGRHGLLVDGRALPDHAEFSEGDLLFNDNLQVLMTEKDAVKCRNLKLPHHWYVTADAQFSEDDATRIVRFVRKRLLAAGVEPTGADKKVDLGHLQKSEILVSG
ncbi:MAG: tetraacyldisaccharide 4'-kinase [Gammaproteobacteria bacterium]